MFDRRLHKFYLSFKNDGKVETIWIEGVNLRHAKEKLILKSPEATDILDWTNERQEDLDNYLLKNQIFNQKENRLFEN